MNERKAMFFMSCFFCKGLKHGQNVATAQVYLIFGALLDNPIPYLRIGALKTEETLD